MNKNSRSFVKLESEILVDDFFEVEKMRIRHLKTDGSWSEEIERFVLHRPDAVCAIVHNSDEQLLYFVEQFRIAAAQKEEGWITELAAGLVDPGETPDEAIKREILEELGFSVSAPVLLNTFFVSPAIISERVFLYYCRVKNADRVSRGGGNAHEHEDIRIHELPVSDIGQFLTGGQKLDAKTMLGIYAVSGHIEDWPI